MKIDCVQLVVLALLAVQSIGWLVTFIRILRLSDEISSASTVIVTLREECQRLTSGGRGADTKKRNSEYPRPILVDDPVKANLCASSASFSITNRRPA